MNNKWISVELKPLFTIDKNGNWICTEDGDREFIAAIPYTDKNKPNKELWWIRHCVIEDEVGLCVVGDDDNEKSGWELEHITHWQPLPPPPTEPNEMIEESKEWNNYFDKCYNKLQKTGDSETFYNEIKSFSKIKNKSVEESKEREWYILMNNEINRLRNELLKANLENARITSELNEKPDAIDLIRSALSIAKRKGETTNWEAFET